MKISSDLHRSHGVSDRRLGGGEVAPPPWRRHWSKETIIHKTQGQARIQDKALGGERLLKATAFGREFAPVPVLCCLFFLLRTPVPVFLPVSVFFWCHLTVFFREALLGTLRLLHYSPP